MLLPHGYEGQGPEHSSARLERYLQLCAEDNIQVCVPSTPAQMFHMLRRQMLRPFRKPLIVMSPKSLLRHRLCVSDMTDLAGGSFQILIDDIDQPKPAKIKRLVLCTGKVYYDLLEKSARKMSRTPRSFVSNSFTRFRERTSKTFWIATPRRKKLSGVRKSRVTKALGSSCCPAVTWPAWSETEH